MRFRHSLLVLLCFALSQSIHAQISILYEHDIVSNTLTMTASGSFDPDSVTAPGAALNTLYIEQIDASNRTLSNGSGTLAIDGQAPDSSNGGNENFSGGTHYITISFAGDFSTTGEWTITAPTFSGTIIKPGRRFLSLLVARCIGETTVPDPALKLALITLTRFQSPRPLRYLPASPHWGCCAKDAYSKDNQRQPGILLRFANKSPCSAE